jgi:ribosomal protein L34E
VIEEHLSSKVEILIHGQPDCVINPFQKTPSSSVKNAFVANAKFLPCCVRCGKSIVLLQRLETLRLTKNEVRGRKKPSGKVEERELIKTPL